MCAPARGTVYGTGRPTWMCAAAVRCARRRAGAGKGRALVDGGGGVPMLRGVFLSDPFSRRIGAAVLGRGGRAGDTPSPPAGVGTRVWVAGSTAPGAYFMSTQPPEPAD